MEFPKNCSECKCSDNCKGPYYGGSYCSFKKEINEHIIAQTLGGKEVISRCSSAGRARDLGS